MSVVLEALEAVAAVEAVEAVPAARFRAALRRHAAGVAVVTGIGPAGPAGVTVTSFASASLEPPLVSFSLDAGSTTWAALRTADAFGVSVLTGEQRGVAERFATKGVDRFAGRSWRIGPLGVPLLSGAAAHLACLRTDVVEIGDHVLVVGLVRHAEAFGGAPLLYHDAGYGGLSAS